MQRLARNPHPTRRSEIDSRRCSSRISRNNSSGESPNFRSLSGSVSDQPTSTSFIGRRRNLAGSGAFADIDSCGRRTISSSTFRASLADAVGWFLCLFAAGPGPASIFQRLCRSEPRPSGASRHSTSGGPGLRASPSGSCAGGSAKSLRWGRYQGVSQIRPLLPIADRIRMDRSRRVGPGNFTPSRSQIRT